VEDMKRTQNSLNALLMSVCIFLFVYSGYADQPDFYFVQITDTHWGSGENVQRTKSIIDSINILPMPIAFVAHTGDLTDHTIENQPFIDSVLVIMRTCKYPVYYVPGNHDILKDRFRETSDAFIRNFGPLDGRSEVHGVSVITLYNLKIPGPDGKMIHDPIAVADSLIRGKPKNQPAIIFQHIPIVDDFYNNVYHPGWPVDDRQKFQKICEKANVAGIIAGHFHRDELHWLGRIPLYVSAPVSGLWGRQSTFRVYHYANGKISYFTQYQ
jgi:3',5'-cyclic AMP phosphodiesterase CpdA